METLVKQRTHHFFILMMLPIFLPIFFALAMLQAKWYGWVVALLSFCALFWMHHKSFWHGWKMILCFFSAYLMASGGVYAARPDWSVSFSAQLSNGIIRTFSSLPPSEQALGKTLLGNHNWSAPNGYTLRVVALPAAKLELLSRTGSQSRHAILQLHGGAFVEGLYDLYRQFAVLYSQLYDDCLVATLDYRLAPTYPYPCQQEDTLSAWRYLTETLGYQAENMIVAGDSAGGNLALSLGLRLRDQGLPMPGGFVCMSPWADLSNSGFSHIYNAALDPSFGVNATDHGQPVGVNTSYTTGLDARNPYLSPSFGDYHAFPPMLLQAGSIEVLLSDSEMVYNNAKANGVDITLTVYKGMFHVFQGTLDLLPESKQAWAEIGQFLQARLQ